MSFNRLNELSLEDLLKKLESSSEKEEFKTDGIDNDVLLFFNTFNLKPGNKQIKVELLYKIYTYWSKNQVTRREFALICSECFERKFASIFIDEKAFAIKRNHWVYFASKDPEGKRLDLNSKRNFDAFIKHFELEQGSELVNIDSLDLLYSRFRGDKIRILSKNRLTEFFKIYFKGKKTRRGTYFKVSPNIWEHLNRQVYEEKEKNQKRRKKAPSADSGDESKTQTRTD